MKKVWWVKISFTNTKVMTKIYEEINQRKRQEMASVNSFKSKFHYYHMANDVVLSNFIANMIGGVLTEVFISHRSRALSERFFSLDTDVDTVFSLFVILLNICIIVPYNKTHQKVSKMFLQWRAIG
jgi:hypothetical protein